MSLNHSLTTIEAKVHHTSDAEMTKVNESEEKTTFDNESGNIGSKARSPTDEKMSLTNKLVEKEYVKESEPITKEPKMDKPTPIATRSPVPSSPPPPPPPPTTLFQPIPPNLFESNRFGSSLQSTGTLNPPSTFSQQWTSSASAFSASSSPSAPITALPIQPPAAVMASRPIQVQAMALSPPLSLSMSAMPHFTPQQQQQQRQHLNQLSELQAQLNQFQANTQYLQQQHQHQQYLHHMQQRSTPFMPLPTPLFPSPVMGGSAQPPSSFPPLGQQMTPVTSRSQPQFGPMSMPMTMSPTSFLPMQQRPYVRSTDYLYQSNMPMIQTMASITSEPTSYMHSSSWPGLDQNMVKIEMPPESSMMPQEGRSMNPSPLETEVATKMTQITQQPEQTAHSLSIRPAEHVPGEQLQLSTDQLREYIRQTELINIQLYRRYEHMKSACENIHSLLNQVLTSGEEEPPEVIFSVQRLMDETLARDHQLQEIGVTVDMDPGTTILPTARPLSTEDMTSQLSSIEVSGEEAARPSQSRGQPRGKPTSLTSVASLKRKRHGATDHPHEEDHPPPLSAASTQACEQTDTPKSMTPQTHPSYEMAMDQESQNAIFSLSELATNRSVIVLKRDRPSEVVDKKTLIHSIGRPRSDAVEHSYGTRAANKTIKFLLSPSPSASESDTEDEAREVEQSRRGVKSSIENEDYDSSTEPSIADEGDINESNEVEDEEFVEGSNKSRRRAAAKQISSPLNLSIPSSAQSAKRRLSVTSSATLPGHHSMTTISDHISRYPLTTIFVKVQRQWTENKDDIKNLTQVEQTELVLVPIRFMVRKEEYRQVKGRVSKDDIYVIAKDISVLIHKRKGSVAKSIYNFNNAEKVRIHVCSRPREAGRGSGVVGGGMSLSGGGASTTGLSTQVLTALSHCGVIRLMNHSRSSLAAYVERWFEEQLTVITNDVSLLREHEARSQRMERLKHLPVAQQKAEESKLIRMEEEEEMDVHEGFEHITSDAGLDDGDDEEDNHVNKTPLKRVVLKMKNEPSDNESKSMESVAMVLLETTSPTVSTSDTSPLSTSSSSDLTRMSTGVKQKSPQRSAKRQQKRQKIESAADQPSDSPQTKLITESIVHASSVSPSNESMKYQGVSPTQPPIKSTGQTVPLNVSSLAPPCSFSITPDPNVYQAQIVHEEMGQITTSTAQRQAYFRKLQFVPSTLVPAAVITSPLPDHAASAVAPLTESIPMILSETAHSIDPQQGASKQAQSATATHPITGSNPTHLEYDGQQMMRSLALPLHPSLPISYLNAPAPSIISVNPPSQFLFKSPSSDENLRHQQAIEESELKSNQLTM